MTFMNTIRRNCLKGLGNIYWDCNDAIWYYWMCVIHFLQYFVIVFRCTVIYRIMHELPWIMILGSRVRRFANDCHEWRNHEWKSLANRLTSDPKIVIHGKKCIILFLTRYFMSWAHNVKNNYRSLISPLSLRTAFSDFVLWRHHSWSVTSHERTALALWRHIRRLLLHAQIGAKAIFTSE